MPIARDKFGFLYWPDAMHAPALGIESERIDACLLALQERRLKGVFGTSPYFSESSLDFLSTLDDIEAVAFWEVKLRDISGLYDLPRLSHMRLSGTRPPISFERLHSLQSMVLEHRKGDSGIRTLTQLKRFNSWRYKSEAGDLSGMELPETVEELRVFWSNATSLRGIPSLPALRRLEIARCRNLSSLGSLAEACPRLEHLEVIACGRLSAEEALSLVERLPSLRHVYVGNQLVSCRTGAA